VDRDKVNSLTNEEYQWNFFQSNVMKSRQSLRQWKFLYLYWLFPLYLYIYIRPLKEARSPFTNGPRPHVGVHTDDRTSLKDVYLCNWLFHNVTLFLNTSPWTVEHMYLLCQTPLKIMWENMRSVLLYNPLKTRWKKWRFHSRYAVKDSYNSVGQIRRNTF
jgi:hypothetical protein